VRSGAASRALPHHSPCRKNPVSQNPVSQNRVPKIPVPKNPVPKNRVPQNQFDALPPIRSADETRRPLLTSTCHPAPTLGRGGATIASPVTAANASIRPEGDLQVRRDEQAGSARKRSSAQGLERTAAGSRQVIALRTISAVDLLQYLVHLAQPPHERPHERERAVWLVLDHFNELPG